MRNYIFFIRTFNDIDHLTPLIYHISGASGNRAFVFCVDPIFDFSKNENIKFLNIKCGINVEYLINFKGLTLRDKFWKMLAQLIKRSEKYFCDSISGRIRSRLISLSKRKLIQSLNISLEWVDRFFHEYNPCALIFDWVDVSAFSNEPIIKKAKSLGIPVFSLPHGINLYTNFDMISAKDRRIDPEKVQFDHIVTQGSLQRRHLEFEGNPHEKIIELGSLRFCREWMQFYRKYIVTSTFESPCDNTRLRVVFFLNKLKYNINKKLLLQTIEMMASDEEVYLIIKPHTRDMRVEFIKQIIDKYQLDVSVETSSVLLSEWCDVGLIIGSSIGLQVLYNNKLLIYPNYLDTNQCYYDELGACWTIDSVNALQKALKIVKENKSYRPYPEENIRALLKDTVYAGDLNRDVIEDYYRFITDKSR